MTVSRLLDGAKLIESQKGIRITGTSRISQFADFAQAIMNRYLVKSVYEFSSASFVFADWFCEERENEEKQRMERDILRLLRLVREYDREKQLPGIYKQLIHQLNRTVIVYENRLGQKSRELLLLCREVSRRGDNAPKYLREPETERRFAQLVVQATKAGYAVPVPGTVFTGRFRTTLENHVGLAGRIPSYMERFLRAKQESTECFQQVFAERMSVLRFVEGLDQEEKEQIQGLFPTFFTAHEDMANVITSMSRVQWKEWKEQVLAMFFQEKEHLPFLVEGNGEKTDFFAEKSGYGDRRLSREQEHLAGKLAFLSVFSGAELMEQTLETILNGSETEWVQTERIFLEMSGAEEVRQLQAIYLEVKRTFEEQIRTEKQLNPVNDQLTSEFSAEVLKLEGSDSREIWSREDRENVGTKDVAVMEDLQRKISFWKKRTLVEESRIEDGQTGLMELLKEMVQNAGYLDDSRNGLAWEEAETGMKERPPAEYSGNAGRTQTNDQSMEPITGKLALLMTISELYGGRVSILNRILPELTDILEYSGEDWEKAQNVLWHLENRSLEQGAYQKPQRLLSMVQVLMRKENFRFLAKQLIEQILRTRNEQETWKEIQREYSREKEAYVRKIQEQNRTIPEEMKPVLGKAPFLLMMQNREEAVEMVTGLFYELPELKMYTGGLSGETDQRKKAEWLGEAIASLDAAEWKLLERRFFGKAGGVSEAGQKMAIWQEGTRTADAPEGAGKAGSPKAAGLLETPEDMGFPVMEYQRKKKQILEQISKESGAVPEDMLTVIGKLPFIQLIKESEETAEYVSRMLYQMPEMEIYTGQWKQQERKEEQKTLGNLETAASHFQAAEILTELIETLNQKEWKLVEERLLRETEKAVERSRKAGDSLRTGMESRNIPKAPAKAEEEREKGWEESKPEYWKIENFLVRELDKIPDRYEGTVPPAVALESLDLPESAVLEFLPLLFPNETERSLAVSGNDGEAEISVVSDIAAEAVSYWGAPQVFREEWPHGMIQESGIYAVGQAAAKIRQPSESSQNFRPTAPAGQSFSTERSIQVGGFSYILLEQGLPEYDFPGYDSGLPAADRVIARTLPPKKIPSPAKDAKVQLQLLQEQPAGKLSEEDIRTVQVMGNKIQTENEYEERLTKLTEQIKIQKEEIDKLAVSQRKLNDPRRHQRIIERMMKQLRGQLRLERLQSGND